MANLDAVREVTAPFDGQVIGTVALSDEHSVDAALDTARRLHEGKAKPSQAERIEILRRAGEIMRDRREGIALQAAQEGGKPLLDSLVEVDRAIDGMDVCIETLRTEQGHVIPMRVNAASKNRIAFTQTFPIGPVVAVSAFNHPFNLVAHQCAPAIATGCPVIVKPASATPLSARIFAEIMTEAGLPEGWCQVANTANSTVATKLVTDPRVAFFSFIGSGKVGWSLRSQLAPGTRCALEHGGVAPVIVAPDADLDMAIPILTKGGFYHAGQVCVSVQRVFVHSDSFERVAEAMTAAAAKLRVGDPTKPETEVGPLIEHREADRVETWVKEAVAAGAGLATGGERLSPSTYAPTVLLNPPADTKIARQEVFGPVVALFKYDDLDDALARANGLEFAFQGAVFTQNIDTAMKIYAGLNASAVMVNDHTAFRTDWMPFAGLGPSGHGVGGMPHTIHEMTVEKMMVINSAALNGL
ncbi:MAG: aldehyde dehydrogenase family protein [Proteobacteria bacterium]|nr:aldehyde dehydrogenase family protein [Pseudomonadota bacterium]